MNKINNKADELRAQFEHLSHGLLCVGPADLSITSRTQKMGHGQQRPEVLTKMEEWLRDDLALHVARERHCILAEPAIVLDSQEGSGTMTILAITIPWSTLQLTKEETNRG